MPVSPPEDNKTVGDQRFPRSARLTKATQYQQVFRQARRSSDRFFTILYRPSNQPRARLGLAVSKKRLKRATDRNRIKRLIRESFRHNQQQLAGLDLVVMVKPGLERVNNRTLLEALQQHWRRIGETATK